MLSTFVLPLIGLLLLGLFISDPFLIFLLVVVIYERKLKKIMPPTTKRGKNLIEHALIGDDTVRKMARRCAFFQWLYAFFWGVMMLVFAGVFAYQKAFEGLILLPIALVFFYWGVPFFRLWRGRKCP